MLPLRPQIDTAPSHDGYEGLFEAFPISLWEEDFSALKHHLDGLRRSGVEDLRAYLAQHPDQLRRCASLVEVVAGNHAKILPITKVEDRELQPGPLYLKARELYWDYAHK